MTKLLIAASLLFSFQAYGKKTEGQIVTAVENAEITLTPKKGFHFNDKAPASVVFDNTEAKLKPSVKTEQKFSFKVLEKARKAKLEFYVCDDAKTVCEKHEQEVSLEKRSTSSEKKAEEKTEAPVFGFEKTTLLKFSAPWCPACIRLKSETMNKPEVKALLGRVKFQEINIDLVENEKIADHYGVKAIPTVILVNEKGEEIKRWLDYQPVKSFVPELSAALKETQTVTSLTEKAEAGDATAATTLGYNSFSKMKWAEAAKWLSVSKGSEELNHKIAAEIYLAEEDDTSASATAHLAALEKGFTLTTSELDRARWKLEYMEKSKAVKKPVDTDALKALQNQIEQLATTKNLKAIFDQSIIGDNENFERAEVLDMLQRLYKLAGDEVSQKKTQAELSKAVDKVKLTTQKPGHMINAIWYYTQAGTPEKAEPLLKQLIKANPKSYVYYQRYASFLSKQKRFDEALKQADLALQHKEGNEPQLSLAKVKILKELGKKEEAVKLIDSTLLLTSAAPKKYKRTQTALSELKAELTKK